MVLDKDKDILFARLGEKMLVVLEKLRGRFCDEDMNTSFNGIESYGVVSRVWSKDGNCISWRKRIDCSFVRIRVARGCVAWVRIEGHVKVVVDGGDVLLEVLACITLIGLGYSKNSCIWQTYG